MSLQKKNIIITDDGSKVGIYKSVPTAPIHLGTDVQTDGNHVVGGNTTIAGTSNLNDLNITGKTIISDEPLDAQKGIEIGEFQGTPNVPMIRKNGSDLEWWNGGQWQKLNVKASKFDLQTSLLFKDLFYVPMSSNIVPSSPFTPVSVLTCIESSPSVSLYSSPLQSDAIIQYITES